MTLRYIQPEDFEHFRLADKHSDTGKCGALLLGAVVLAIVVFVMANPTTCQQHVQKLPMIVSSMKSAIQTSISARRSAFRGMDVHANMDVDSSSVVNLTYCAADDTKCNDFTKVEEDTLKLHGNILKKFDEKHDDYVALVFAPWCGHCKTALPKFCEASEEADVKCVLVNAEMIPPTLLQGEIFNVTHFPFIVRRNKKSGGDDIVLKGEASKENIVELGKKQTDDELQMMFH